MTTSEAIKHFLDELPGRSQNTKRTYAMGLKLFAKIVGEDAALDVESYKKFLLDTRHMEPGTQITYRAAVRAMLLRLDVSPSKLKQYTSDYGLRLGKRLPTFDEDAVDKIVNYANTLHWGLGELRDRALIITLVDTGLRRSEICSLRRGDIDRKRTRAIIIGKGDKQDIVRFSERSLAAIDDYLRARGKLDGASGKPLASLPLFARHDKRVGKTVKPLGACGAWATFKRRLKDAGLDRLDVRVHDCRHAFVTTVVRESNGNMKLAQELARHASMNTTQRYAHMSDGELDRGYNDIFNK